jgi:FHS family L-fucose permease-like MFS transporter
MPTTLIDQNIENNNSRVDYKSLSTLITVFFFWGFVAASNDILIPVFKKEFDLTQGQSQLVSLSFYIAYTVGAIIYQVISYSMKSDLVNKLGYKNSLALGLVISAVGTLLFYPAANSGSFELMLSGLFVVGLGFSLQQTVANPLAIALGPSKTGSQRLTLAGGINNFGTTIGPLIVSFAIFGTASASEAIISIEAVKIPYLILGVAFLLVAFLLKISSIPDRPESDDRSTDQNNINRGSALKYPQLLLGMIAIFLYVGVEVSTASNLPDYMEKELGFGPSEIAPYISLYWASLMIGRWTGAVQAFGVTDQMAGILKFIVPYLAFGVFLLVNIIAGHEVGSFLIYAVLIILLIVADIASKGNPARMLLLFSCLAITALITGMLTGGKIGVFAFISVGLFCSTLWPCIFALAIKGLGKNTSQGSSFLIMMIMGGGIVSWVQGLLADMITVNYSYIIGILCFAYLAFYAVQAKKILINQGIEIK